MIRTILGSSVLTLVWLAATDTSIAHHPPRFERCALVTFSGQIERIEWGNPHVVLHLRTDSGESREVGWLNLQALTRNGIHADTLKVGDHLVVQGGSRANDVIDEPILVSSLSRPSDGWKWSQPLQGC